MGLTEKDVKHFLKNDSKEYLEFKTALNILGDKWSALIIMCIFDHPKRFVDIQNYTSGISPRTLAQRLHVLEDAGLITRQEFKEFPPRTEYTVTKKAQELKTAMAELKKWAKKYCTATSTISHNPHKH
jgi:DNA-binding HxlR family transcriptional regulator